MKSTFEYLPVEIFYEVFDFLSVYDILRSFTKLTKRIDDIVGSYPLELDFKEISRTKFDFICRRIQPKQVITINLSDEFMPDQVKLFHQYFPDFDDRFIGLKTIKFINVSMILPNLPQNVSSLSIKTYLKANNTDNFIRKILNQQSQYLTYLKVDGCYVFRSINTSFSLLKQLVIDYCTVTEFHRILPYLPIHLTHLNIFIDQEENTPKLNFKPLSNSLRNLTLTLSDEIFMTFELVKEFLKDLVKLKELNIEATGTIDLMDGQLWEEYLSEREITQFNFKFTLSNQSIGCDYDKNFLLESFRSSFWIDQHHWYVACEKGEFKASRPIIYSVPYFQPKLIFYPSNSSPSLTISNKEIMSNCVNNLILTFHKTITFPNLFFNRVQSLTLLALTLPSIELIQSIVNLKKVEEIDVSLVTNLAIDEFDILIGCMVNLKSIKMEYNPLFVPPLRIYSYVFIRKDDEMFIIDENNLKRFCYLFFHIRNLEITVSSKHVIIQLLNRLYYLERIKIFCYQESLLNIKYDWFQENIPRFSRTNFTYRATSTCLFLSIGSEKIVDEKVIAEDIEHRAIKCRWHKSCSTCQLQ